MKNFRDCIEWMEALTAYRIEAPEGVYMAKKDTVVTLRDVDPAVIIELNEYFTNEPLPGVCKWVCKLEGDKEGAYCSLTITKYGAMGYKLPNCAYRFFYRKMSDHTRREAYNYVL